MNAKWQKVNGRKAVFLWGSLESAKAATYSEAFNGQLDGAIFRVDIPQSWIHEDTTEGGEDEPTDRYACFRRIPPNCLGML